MSSVLQTSRFFFGKIVHFFKNLIKSQFVIKKSTLYAVNSTKVTLRQIERYQNFEKIDKKNRYNILKNILRKFVLFQK